MKPALMILPMVVLASAAHSGERYDGALELAVKRIVAEKFAGSLRAGYELDESPRFIRHRDMEITASVANDGWVDGLAPARELVIAPLDPN